MLPPMFESFSRRVYPLPCFLLLLCFVAAGACGGTTAASNDGGSGDAKPNDAGLDATRSDAGPKDGGDSSLDGPPKLITEPDQGMAPVYAFMSSAKHSLDMTMYELNDTTATNLLVTAAKNGVTVRVILDQNLEMKDNMGAYNALSAAGSNVTVHWANPSYAATHQKTITVDRTTSAVMSLNFAEEFYATTRDFALITTDPADVAAIETTFEADLANAAITPPNGTNLVWSPTNSEVALLALINGAKSSLLVENEEMSYDEIISALTRAASRGVDVKVVMNESREWDQAFDTLTAAGVKVVTYHDAAIYIHAKVIVADFGMSTAHVFLGSENFSHASLTENRELGILTTDLPTMTSINGTLTKDYEGATPFVPMNDGGPSPSDAAMPTDGSPPSDGSSPTDGAGSG
jgi:cardiolipin synthase A/B